MRAKSSRVFTSLSSRRPFRCAVYQRALARRRDRIPADENLLQRAEQERERGAELVAHVGEERGLRAFELRECFGLAALWACCADALQRSAGILPHSFNWSSTSRLITDRSGSC